MRITDYEYAIVMFTQFAGGFDAESMAAFEALRNRAHKQSCSSQRESP